MPSFYQNNQIKPPSAALILQRVNRLRAKRRGQDQQPVDLKNGFRKQENQVSPKLNAVSKAVNKHYSHRIKKKSPSSQQPKLRPKKTKVSPKATKKVKQKLPQKVVVKKLPPSPEQQDEESDANDSSYLSESSDEISDSSSSSWEPVSCRVTSSNTKKTPDDSVSTTISEYETLIQQKVLENRKFLASLNLMEDKENLMKVVNRTPVAAKKPSVKRVLSPTEVRLSSRLSTKPTRNYTEDDQD